MRLFALLILFPFSVMAQLNMSQLGYLDVPGLHTTKCNDIWGYEDGSGNEYALIGTEDGFSIIDVTDPANPSEIYWIPGMNSVWRDIKVYGDYAYVTTEALEGLLIIDLTSLPGTTGVTYQYYSGPTSAEWLSAHNIYQADGYLYIFGANRDNGGVIILDVNTDPYNPTEVGTFDNWYAHDGFVRNDTGYFAHINDGFFSIVDLTNKSTPVLLGTSPTPGVFTHNIWISDDGNYAFTTDETAGGYIAAFDVSDPSSIKYLDKIQSSPGDNIVPHNAHVYGDYLVTSYYTDGVLIHDITHPHNIIEVGNFDTSPLSNASTSGCWGAYPFLTSGNILATDREEGLFVLNANYQQGAYLEGNITEQGSGNPINNVEISINGTSITDLSTINGDYATGIASAGTYDVEYFKILYYPETISTNLSQGTITNQDVVLEKIPQYSVNVTVLDAQTLNPIQGATVMFDHNYIDHEEVTDANGEVSIGLYYEDNYDIIVGKWGYVSECFIDSLITSSVTNMTLYLDQGIFDDFSLDFGWSVYGDAQSGMWERGVVKGVQANNGHIEAPFNDNDWDCGQSAYLTGNSTTAPQGDDVYGGETVLMSPVFDLSGYSNPHINFSAFYYNLFGPFPPDDTLFISLFNGTETVDVAKIHKDNTTMSIWTHHSVPVPTNFTLTNNTQLMVRISDYPATLNVTEAGFDYFSITDFSTAEIKNSTDEIEIYPNPMNEKITIQGVSQGSLTVYDIHGRIVSTQKIVEKNDVSALESGVYIFVIKDISGNIVALQKGVKK